MTGTTPDQGILSKSLNMPAGSPRFIRVALPDGRGRIESPPEVLPGQGEVWLAGETRLKSGETIPSVFAIDTDAGGSLLAAWWRIEGRRFRANDAEALRALGRSPSEVAPWDWRYAVRVVEDIYHG